MVLWYTDKIDNPKLGYCMYLDLKEDKEYWYDYISEDLYLSYGAGNELHPVPFTEGNYVLMERTDG